MLFLICDSLCVDLQNVHSSTDYTGKVSFFKCSAAHATMVTFLQTLNRAVQGKTLSQLSGSPVAGVGAAPKKIQLFASDAPKGGEEESKQQPAAAAPAPVAPPAGI